MTRTAISLMALIMVLGLLWFFMPTSKPVPVIAIPKETWHDFAAPDGKFNVKLPSLPQQTSEMVEDPITHEKRRYHFFLSSKDNGTIYAINTIDFPENKNDDFTQNYIQQMLLSNSNNKIQSIETKPFRKGNAVDFIVQNAEVTIDGKAFFQDNILYILSTTSRNEHHNAKEFLLFVDSFQLPSKGPEKGKE